jgi:hypothetical protein
VTKYKYKLSADIKDRNYESFRELKCLAAKRADLDNLIENAVINFYRDLTRTVVTVDHANLDRIRKEALGTQASLIVPENDGIGQLPESGLKEAEGMGNGSEAGNREPEDMDHRSETGSHEPRFIVQSQDGGKTPYTAGYGVQDDSQAGNNWVALKAALSVIELEALSIALRDATCIKPFADDNSIMLEVLADGINEKAADYIGDSILELDGSMTSSMTIFDEYVDIIAKMVGEHD